MEKEGNVKKDLLGIFYSKICFLLTFFYTVVARSGGGMVDLQSEASDTLAVHGTWIPRKNSKIHRRLGVDALGWWNGRHVRFRCVCLRVCGFKSHL